MLQDFIVKRHCPTFVYLPFCQAPECLHLLATINIVATNISAQTPVQVPAFGSARGGGIASRDSSRLSFLINYHKLFEALHFSKNHSKLLHLFHKWAPHTKLLVKVVLLFVLPKEFSMPWPSAITQELPAGWPKDLQDVGGSWLPGKG